MNKWACDLLNNLKKNMEDSFTFKQNQNIDFFYNDQWMHGKIIDLDLIHKSFVIKPFIIIPNMDEIKIPFEKEKTELASEFKYTINWRNKDYLLNHKQIKVFTCNSDSCNSQEYICEHEKKWVPSVIVYFCDKSNFILLVYYIQDPFEKNEIVQSKWVSIDDKNISLFF
jgi:hypothetical protein